MPESAEKDIKHAGETIAAIATPPGRGGIGVLRISGPASGVIAETLLGACPRPRQATLSSFRGADGELLDQGIALFFPAPHSYTGEDVLELQAHGGPVLLDLLLQCALSAGARQARAGEFTERAFINEKLDLSQAEAVADLIDAASARAVHAARRSMAGEFSRRVRMLTDELIVLRSHIEAGLDFAEDEPGVLADAAIARSLGELLRNLDATRKAALSGRRLHDGYKVVIAGAPNVGKSSLLNRLSGSDRAIVTSIPGTTRDPVSESIIMDGLLLELTDTAGLRDSRDAVESIGIEKALEHSRKADLVLLVFDDEHGPGASGLALRQSLPAGCDCLPVRNKVDLQSRAARSVRDAIAVSARTGAGIETLLEAIRRSAGSVAAEGEFSARQRHVRALDEARDALLKARGLCRREQAVELLAEELRLGQQALEEITGRFSSDDLLGRIFSSFCIGK